MMEISGTIFTILLIFSIFGTIWVMELVAFIVRFLKSENKEEFLREIKEKFENNK